jgi:hypothetical protein
MEEFAGKNDHKSGRIRAGCWWLTPVIPATWEADIERIEIQAQPGQIVHETTSSPK